jgi:hypothetical protein
MTLEETKKFVNLEAIRLTSVHGAADLTSSFQGNFTPAVRQAYDDATDELELYQ